MTQGLLHIYTEIPIDKKSWHIGSFINYPDEILIENIEQKEEFHV